MSANFPPKFFVLDCIEPKFLANKFLETKILKINDNFKIESLQCPKNSEVKVVTPVIARA